MRAFSHLLEKQSCRPQTVKYISAMYSGVNFLRPSFKLEDSSKLGFFGVVLTGSISILSESELMQSNKMDFEAFSKFRTLNAPWGSNLHKKESKRTGYS